MTRERRSLWGSISQSKKVNKISLKAALLYTWAISHFDDEGFQAGEPRDIKINIVPFRDDIPLEEIKNLIIELNIAELWDVFHINSTVYIRDPVWDQRQFFKGIHKIPSKIKKIIGDTPMTVYYDTPEGVRCHLDGRISEVKLSEVKLREVKGSTPENPFSLDDEGKKKKEREEINRKVQLYKEKESRL
jgi:hypothetical protein